MKLFQYVLIHRPKAEKKDERAPEPKVIKGVTEVLAADDRTALMLAARAIPEELAGKIDEVEIALRPF